MPGAARLSCDTCKRCDAHLPLTFEAAWIAGCAAAKQRAEDPLVRQDQYVKSPGPVALHPCLTDGHLARDGDGELAASSDSGSDEFRRELMPATLMRCVKSQ